MQHDGSKATRLEVRRIHKPKRPLRKITLRFLEEMCLLRWRLTDRRLRGSVSEIDLSVPEKEVIQIFACWMEDLVGVTNSCSPVVDELILANVCDHGWEPEQNIFEVLVAGVEEERKTSGVRRKVFALALAFPFVAPRCYYCCRAVWLCPQCLSRRKARMQVLCGCTP